MLLIRDAQMEVFEQEAQRLFERRLLAHVRAYFPAHVEALGDSDAQALIHDSVQQARGFGFASDRHLCAFATLTMALGDRFYEQPAFEWAAALLRDGRPASVRMDVLQRQTLAHLTERASAESAQRA